MKIKTKKQLNLSQLIEWAAKNKIKNQIFRADKQLMNVQFYKSGDFETFGFTGIDIIFTVEVEEDITEDTEFKLMIEILDCTPNCLWERASINDWKDEDSKEFHAYIDGEFKCIWRDGKLIEE